MFGGVILSLIEGVSIMLTKYMVPPEALQEEIGAPVAPISLSAPMTHTTVPVQPSNYGELPSQEERSTFH